MRSSILVSRPLVAPPQEYEDGHERQRRPLVDREIEPELRLGTDVLGGETIEQIRDDVELDELAAEDAAGLQQGQHHGAAAVEGELVQLCRMAALAVAERDAPGQVG